MHSNLLRPALFVLPIRPPEHITFTGVDNDTDITQMMRLSCIYPIEWGILFSRKRQGDDPRYPLVTKIQEIVKESKYLKLAAHICGSYAEDIVKNKSIGDFPIEFSHFRRIQINHPAPNLRRVAVFSERVGVRCIIQSTDPAAIPYYTDLDVLYDRSGGQGIVPTTWPISPMWRGYAGGLNETNILGVIKEVGNNQYWMDLESGARVDNKFSLETCAKICELIYGKGRNMAGFSAQPAQNSTLFFMRGNDPCPKCGTTVGLNTLCTLDECPKRVNATAESS